MDANANLPSHNYNELRHGIRSGDILLCSGNSAMSNIIQKATGSIWSHVAFILRLDFIDRILVLECVESIGVRAIPLRNYVVDYNGTGRGYPGKVLLARHHDVKQEKIINLSKTALDLLGYPYNTQEILRIAARISMHALGGKFNPDPLTGREFICSEYAYVCFKSIGVSIEFNQLGFVAPADFAGADKVEGVSYIETENVFAGGMQITTA
jgi:hypothetical protein